MKGVQDFPALDKLNRLLYCGGVKGALSMSIFWVLVWMARELYSGFVGIGAVFSNIEELAFWGIGALTVCLSICGINNKIDRIKYAGLHFGSLMQIWIAVQLYLSGDESNSIIPASVALWLFGAAIHFKGITNARTSVSQNCE